VSKEYSRIENFINSSRQRKEEVDGELAAMKSRYGSAQHLPDEVVDRISTLAPESAKLLNWIKSGTLLLDILVEEYDVLSRMEEAERKYKAKAISQLDYLI